MYLALPVTRRSYLLSRRRHACPGLAEGPTQEAVILRERGPVIARSAALKVRPLDGTKQS